MRGFCAVALFALSGCGLVGPQGLAGQAGGPLAASNLAAPEQVDAIDRSVERVTRRPASHDNSFQMWLDGPDAYSNLYAMIKSAKRTIWVSTFEFHGDAQGLAYTTLLGAKARAGVEVKVMVDQLGGSLETDTAVFLDMIRDAGGEIRRYRAQWVKGSLGIYHRKLHIVDGEVAMTGGMNIGNQYFTDYHDTLATVRGGAVSDMGDEFFRDWVRAGGKAPKTLPAAPSGGDTRIRVLTTSAPEDREEIRDGLMAAIGAAKDHINMAVPYFADEDLIEMLQDASRRGVKVRVMIPDLKPPRKTIDVSHIFNRIHPSAARKLLKAGAEVRLYVGRKLHLKVTEIDGAWVSYGSANGDTMSYLRNQELNLAIADAKVAADVRTRLFEADVAHSRPITEEDLNVPFFARPINSAFEALAYYLGVNDSDLVPRAQ